MIGCLRTRVHKQPIIALYFESENELKFYNLQAWSWTQKTGFLKSRPIWPSASQNQQNELCTQCELDMNSVR